MFNFLSNKKKHPSNQLLNILTIFSYPVLTLMILGLSPTFMAKRKLIKAINNDEMIDTMLAKWRDILKDENIDIHLSRFDARIKKMMQVREAIERAKASNDLSIEGKRALWNDSCQLLEEVEQTIQEPKD